MVLTERTFLQAIQEDGENRWELHRGRLREKPSMSFQHNWSLHQLFRILDRQLDPHQYDIRINSGRTGRADRVYYIPDLMVIPIAATEPFQEHPGTVEIYTVPLPLVVEAWSPSTGDYDIDEKIPEYQARGDREIWRLHPLQRTLTRYVRGDDGSYTPTEHGACETVELSALPNVRVRLQDIFSRESR